MIGFGTGCLYKNINPLSKEAIEIVRSTGCKAIELGAGKVNRMPLLEMLNKEDFYGFDYKSFHFPCDVRYSRNEEAMEVIRQISEAHDRIGFDTLVIHPDLIDDWEYICGLDLPLSFENLETSKSFGRSVDEMQDVFSKGDFGFVLDLMHAFVCDPSMNGACKFYEEFHDRLCQFHLSGYSVRENESPHAPLFFTKQLEIMSAVALDKPIIIESVFSSYSGEDKGGWLKEQLAKELNYIETFLLSKNKNKNMKEDALEYHRAGNKNRAGKIGTDILTSVKGREDLTLAYSPGVAAPCLEIAGDLGKIYEYTNKGNTVAVVSNGSAVLGLGNIGAAAGKPVMEGKALLFKHFADVDARDVLIDSQNPDDIIEVVKLISPTYGGINLEDIKAPECFYVEEKLKEILDIPVFHDDQHGTAIVVGAGLINALKISGKKIEDVRVVFSGAGAAGIAIAKMVVRLGVRRENLIMCDSRGVVYVGRDAGDSTCNSVPSKLGTHKEVPFSSGKKEFAVETSKRDLREAVDGADVFIGVSKRDVLTSEMLMSMNENPAVFAMANPNPEIDYDLAKRTRDDVIMSTGRSDYPNQVNNVLGFPGIFRGTLDVKARKINEEMKVAAVFALANLVDNVSKDYIVPSPFDDRVVVEVAFAVAKAAVKSGVVDSGFDLDEYRKKLEDRFLRKEIGVGDVRAGEKYRHFKGGEYEIVSVAEDSDDLKKVVVYRALYDGRTWARRLDEFCGFRNVDGKKVKRFEKIEEGMSNVKVRVKKLKENAVVPVYAHEGDAGMDLCSTEDYVVPVGKRQLVSTGISMELPKGYWASIRGKSGLAYKKGISILGGVIEYTYTGEYGVIVLNTGDEEFVIKAGDKVAQVVISPVASVEVEEVSELSDTVRGEGGFGSTGV